MKWREPWAISIRQQARFNPLGRGVLKSALVWSAMFAGLAIMVNLGEDLSVQMERLSRLWFAPAIGVPLALLVYAAGWLSPRRIESGPNGIVIVKGQELDLIPWRAIENYAFGRSDGRDILAITHSGGGSHVLFLSDKVHPKEVERELMKETGKQPDNSSRPTPLRGAA